MKFLLGLIVGFLTAWLFIEDRRTPAFPNKPVQAPGQVAIPPRSEQVQTIPEPARVETTGPATLRDPLEKITGIGPVFTRRLNQAGILTFEQLAGQEPERLREIVQAASWQAVDPVSWIEQAREFSNRPQ